MKLISTVNKDYLKEFTFKNRQGLAFDSFFEEIVPSSYCPWTAAKKIWKYPCVLSVQ